MTVDDKSFQHFALNNQIKARDWVNQVKEVTGKTNIFSFSSPASFSSGCNDEDEIKRAFEKSKDSHGEFSLSGAVEQLLGSVSRSTAVVPVSSGSTSVALNTSPQKAKVVDLTDDNKTEDDLQKAIALSLQDGGLVSQSQAGAGAGGSVSGISQEEQDVSKALEASLLESTQSGRKSSQNPRDRQREGQWPVGLKNVGQTCWFSAVIQSLFYIPAFRTLVLNYTAPSFQANSEKRKKILEFMMELRKLFSLLMNSQRKYVDPSRAVGILRGTLGGGGESSQGGSNQQDVSEFTHKLLDWLEEAFNVQRSDNCDIDKRNMSEPMDSDCEKMDKEKESEETSSMSSPAPAHDMNQMNSLFYGKVEIEGRNQGIEFSRTEQFGQWPLQVNGFKHIHDSLEASMAYQAIDSGETSDLSGQERWFTILPPVLVLELSRFQFNTSKGVAEKVNNILEFPQDIFLDRYLENNKALVRKKREEVKSLIERRENLKKQLDCYMRYRAGSEESSQQDQYPLVSILRSALEFAKSGSGGGQEVDCGEVTMQVDSPCHSPASLTPAQSLANLGGQSEASSDPGAPLSPITVATPIVREETGAEGDLSQDAMEIETADSEQPIPPIQLPRPRIVSEMEMKVLSSCLGRWIKEVEEEIVALSRSLESIEASISVMYEEEGIKMRGYRLHAVMVHEGDVNQGHYWAYVNHRELGWLKFNDNTVSQTSWEEISKEAVGGGQSSTSAYSCVYVDVAKSSLFSDPQPPHLPTDLDTFVMEDNKNFAAEVVKWDEEQHRQKVEEEAAAAATVSSTGASGAPSDSAVPVLIGDDPDCQIIEPKPDLAQSHALLAKDITMEFFGVVAAERKKGEATKNNTSNVINKIYSAIKPKVQAGRTEGFADSQDIRLESFLHYLIANDLTVDHYKKALLEQVALKQFELMSDLGGEVARTAKDSLRQIPPQVSEEVTLWHRTYHQFRIAVNYFVLGVEKYTENLAEDALELLTISYVVNDRIMEDPPPGVYKGMTKRGLMKHFHLAVEAVNTKLVEEFETGSDPANVSRRVGETLVPAIHVLQARTNKTPGGRDASLLEEVRGRWCAMIEQPLSDKKRDYWATIFQTVMPDDNSGVMKSPANLRYPKYTDDQKLGLRYKLAMQRIMRETDK